MEEGKKIVLFDGVCNLCNGFVQFIIKKDLDDTFRFAALQSEVGQQLILKRGIDPKKMDSVFLIEPGVAYFNKSDAALQIGQHLNGYRTLSKLLYLIPNKLRNIVYDYVGRNRYKWYGKTTECMVPTPEIKAKFLE